MRHRRGDAGKEAGSVREPQGDDVTQAECDHEAQEQGALALRGMTLTEAFEEYMGELVYRGGPPMRASREAKANTMRIRFEVFMESGLGAGEEGEHTGEGGAR